MLPSTTTFRPRKRDVSTLDLTPSSSAKRVATDLTRNANYRVAKLTHVPAQGLLVTNGYADGETGYGVMITGNTIQVWPYALADPYPHIYEIAAPDASTLAVVTRPSPNSPNDPGLVTISTLGNIYFYELVRHAQALELMNNTHWEASLPLTGDEVVTLAETVEPTGVVVATSHGRCFVVLLRDTTGKPNLEVQPLEIGTGLGARLLLKVFGSPALRHSEIVLIKRARRDDAVTHRLVVLTKSGEILVFTCHLLSSLSYCLFDEKKLFRHQLYNNVESLVSLPGGSSNLEFFDVAWVKDDIYLVLCQVGRQLVLLTMTINETGLMVMATHRIVVALVDPNGFNPKLFLPAPDTAFVTIDNTVFLTDVNPVAAPLAPPKWEDQVVFRLLVVIIGYGEEQATATTNLALLVVTQNEGLVRIERFKTSPTVDEAAIIKSHVEQGIFYSQSDELSFDLPQGVHPSDNTVRVVIDQIIGEVMKLTSPYLHNLPAVLDTLSRKIDLLRQLLSYCEKNFTVDIKHGIYTNVEKLTVSLELWKCLEKFPQLKPVAELCITGDVVEFFSNGVEEIGTILTPFFDKLVAQDVNISTVAYVVVATQFNGVYVPEHEAKATQPRHLWVLDSPLLFTLLQIYTKYFGNPNLVVSHTEVMTRYCELIYFYATTAIAYMEVDHDANLDEYSQWYAQQKHQWIEPLVVHNLAPEAMAICERYQDYDNLAYVIDQDEDPMVFAHMFDEYGYPFAASVYRYYLQHNQPAKLVSDNTVYLQRFFEENRDSTAAISWISYLKAGNFDAAASLLVFLEKNDDDTLAGSQLKLSIAKLVQAAGRGVEAIAPEISNDLLKVASQARLYKTLKDTWKNALKGKALLSVDDGVSSKEEVVALVEPAYNTIAENNQLSNVIDIVNLLTLLKQLVTGGVQAYADAIKVALLMENQQDGYKAQQVAWIRVLSLAHDWQILNRLEKQTDLEVKHSIHNLVLFKVAQLVDTKDFSLLFLVVDTEVDSEVADALKVDTTFLSLPKLSRWVHATVEEAKI